jgi:hypothetical protein
VKHPRILDIGTVSPPSGRCPESQEEFLIN